ncbi:hypothetical protein MLD38_037456 [Melastoma candidum]|uniref:Uncharacterized protein n=1 Tax=Melastoma candidum TaxID=119954 RepID=A0ACB9LNT4_9MYRT|nr:hypothetical protein MLD38_037456 [Melastoma candidum]
MRQLQDGDNANVIQSCIPPQLLKSHPPPTRKKPTPELDQIPRFHLIYSPNGGCIIGNQAYVPLPLQLGSLRWMIGVRLLSLVLVLALKTLKESGHHDVYDAVERPLHLAQTAILHNLVGLVRSPITATLPQIGSRLFVTWGILYSFPEIRTHVLVSSLVISWSITEIIRYSFFGVKESLGFTPSWLLWLRYSTFLLLYPTGITSEFGLIYLSLPYIKNSEKFCVKMPNKWNFSFNYFYASILVLGVYVPGNPHMYNYMLRQRKKALAKTKRE